MRALFIGALLAVTVSSISTAAQQLSTVQPGYAVGSLNSFSSECAAAPVTAGFSDGTYVAFDGRTIELRTAEGVTTQFLAILPGQVFASFIAVSPDEQTIIFGESSTGTIRSIPRAGGQDTLLATLENNYDLAFDLDPNFAYVAAGTNGSGFNSVWRLNLLAGTAEELASLVGFSGPITVMDNGDVLTGRLQFGSSAVIEVLRFTDAQLDSGLLLDDSDATVIIPGLSGLSSMVYDRGNDQLFLMETGTGPLFVGSTLWRASATGALEERVVEADSFSTGLELVDAGIGTKFGPYQPPFAALRYTTNRCFGTPGIAERVTLRGARPENVWTGPDIGTSGTATFKLSSGIVDGWASLWAARSNTFSTVDVVTDIGGFYPIALRASEASFIRRFAPIQIDGIGEARFNYFHTPILDGAFIGQWVMFDENMNPITTTRAVLNR